MMDCRCGRATETDHPCHGDAYSCLNPGTERMLTYPVGLAGMQFKLGAYQTWACDEHWTAHKAQLRLHSMVLQIIRDEKVMEYHGHAHITYDDDLGAWVLHVNGEVKAVYQPHEVDGLTTIDMSNRTEAAKAAIEAIWRSKFGDDDPLSKEMIGEFKNPNLGVRDA